MWIGHIQYMTNVRCEEDIPPDAPKPRGKSVRLLCYVDANLAHDNITGRSVTGIYMAIMNLTIITHSC